MPGLRGAGSAPAEPSRPGVRPTWMSRRMPRTSPLGSCLRRIKRLPARESCCGAMLHAFAGVAGANDRGRHLSGCRIVLRLGPHPRVDEWLDHAGLVNAVSQRPVTQLSRGPVRMLAQFLEQGLRQVFALAGSGQDHKGEQVSTRPAHREQRLAQGELLVDYSPEDVLDAVPDMPCILDGHPCGAEAVADREKRAVHLGDLGTGRVTA